MGALALIVAAVSMTVASDSATSADELSAELRASRARLAAAEERIASQSVDLASTQTALRVLRRDVEKVTDEAGEETDIADVTRRVLASVFTVETPDGSGSSFVVSSQDGKARLLTNAHVISSVWNNGGRGVELAQAERRLSATIVDVSFSRDLALLEVNAELPPLDFATQRTDAGTPVLVVGSPLGLEGSVSSGVVSSYRVEEGQEQMQLSAPVNPGNSGGPVTDDQGTVLGVVVAKYVGFEVEGVSFAVPSDVVCATFDICRSE